MALYVVPRRLTRDFFRSLLDVVPAAETGRVAVSGLESAAAAIASLPDGAPNFRYLRFRVTAMTPPRDRYIAFNLVDLNRKPRDYGTNPINPTASICVPIGEAWLTP